MSDTDETHNRQRRLALIITAIFLAVMLVMAFKPVNHDRVPLRIFEYLHIIAFGALVLPSALLHPRLLLWIAPMLIGLGTLVEVVQPYFGRGAEWHDIAFNFIGVFVGISLGLAARRVWLAASNMRV